jgi:hypothetical protein
VGHAGGVWPGTIFRGRVVSASGKEIWSKNEIAGGQSGGSMIDPASGYLVGVTNWGKSGGLCGAAGPGVVNAGLDKLLPPE